MFLPLKVQNPAILPRRPIHAKIIVKYGGLGSGEDRPPGEDGRILRLYGQKRAFGAGHSTVFAKWCPYAGERPKMALKVRESAQIAYFGHITEGI